MRNPTTDVPGFVANVKIHSAKDALPALHADLARARTIDAWIYLLDPHFFEELFREHLPRATFFAVADHRQKHSLALLAHDFPNFRPRTWAWNRTQHDKTILLPDLQVTWLLTHNLTRGSWTMSSNRAARVESAGLTHRLASDFLRDYARARAVLPKFQC